MSELINKGENQIGTTIEGLTASWQPSDEDQKHLTQHIVRKRTKEFLSAQIFLILVTSMGAPGIFHRFTALKALPDALCYAVWALLMISIYVYSSWQMLRSSITHQSNLNTIALRENRLTLQYDNGDRTEYPLPSARAFTREAAGIFFDLGGIWIHVPQHALVDNGDKLEEAFVYSAQAAQSITIPQPPNADAFPFAITFQQSKADFSHAYHNGWSRPMDRSGCGIALVAILFGPMLFCFVMALLTGSSLDTAKGAVPVGLFISAIIGIPYLIFTASASPQINAAQQRHPFEQPLLVALGPDGAAIHGGLDTNIVDWKDIRKISGDERLIYLDMPDDLILIPRSAFLDSRHADEFLAAAKAYKNGKIPSSNSMS